MAKNDGPTKLRWKYTEEQKREALRIYTEEGPAAAAKATGIPRGTMSRWAAETGARTVASENTREATEAAAQRAARLREGLKLQCRDRAVDLVDRMAEMEVLFVGKDGKRVEVDRAGAAACKDLAYAAAILIDKAELLDGRATSRNEHRNIDALDREIDNLLGAHDRGEPQPTG